VCFTDFNCACCVFLSAVLKGTVNNRTAYTLSVLNWTAVCAGNVLLVTAPGSDRDVLWCLSSDPYPFHRYLVEMQTVVPLDGIVWAMAEVQGGDMKAVLPSISSQDSGTQGPIMTPDPPLVVRQHMESPRKYIILTQQVCQNMWW